MAKQVGGWNAFLESRGTKKIWPVVNLAQLATSVLHEVCRYRSGCVALAKTRRSLAEHFTVTAESNPGRVAAQRNHRFTELLQRRCVRAGSRRHRRPVRQRTRREPRAPSQCPAKAPLLVTIARWDLALPTSEPLLQRLATKSTPASSTSTAATSACARCSIPM